MITEEEQTRRIARKFYYLTKVQSFKHSEELIDARYWLQHEYAGNEISILKS